MKLMHIKNYLFVTLFLVFGFATAQAQTGNIQGTISDENGIYVDGFPWTPNAADIGFGIF